MTQFQKQPELYYHYWAKNYGTNIKGEGNIDLNKLKTESLTLLSNWNGDMNSHTPEPLIYQTWISTFQKW